MDEAAGMAVSSLVQILIGRLQVEIGDRMLEHENRNGGEEREGELMASALLRHGLGRAVPIRRRRVDPEIGDALAIERVERDRGARCSASRIRG